MPLVRIDLPAGKPATYRTAVSAVVYDAMVSTLNVPKDDRFMVIAEHSGGDLVIDPNYLGISRSSDALIIQLTLNEGRTLDVKRGFYKAVADGLHAKVGLRREDVVISLVEVKKEVVLRQRRGDLRDLKRSPPEDGFRVSAPRRTVRHSGRPHWLRPRRMCRRPARRRDGCP